MSHLEQFSRGAMLAGSLLGGCATASTAQKQSALDQLGAEREGVTAEGNHVVACVSRGHDDYVTRQRALLRAREMALEEICGTAAGGIGSVMKDAAFDNDDYCVEIGSFRCAQPYNK